MFLESRLVEFYEGIMKKMRNLIRISFTRYIKKSFSIIVVIFGMA